MRAESTEEFRAMHKKLLEKSLSYFDESDSKDKATTESRKQDEKEIEA